MIGVSAMGIFLRLVFCAGIASFVTAEGPTFTVGDCVTCVNTGSNLFDGENGWYLNKDTIDNDEVEITGWLTSDCYIALGANDTITTKLMNEYNNTLPCQPLNDWMEPTGVCINFSTCSDPDFEWGGTIPCLHNDHYHYTSLNDANVTGFCTELYGRTYWTYAPSLAPSTSPSIAPTVAEANIGRFNYVYDIRTNKTAQAYNNSASETGMSNQIDLNGNKFAESYRKPSSLRRKLPTYGVTANTIAYIENKFVSAILSPVEQPENPSTGGFIVRVSSSVSFAYADQNGNPEENLAYQLDVSDSMTSYFDENIEKPPFVPAVPTESPTASPSSAPSTLANNGNNNNKGGDDDSSNAGLGVGLAIAIIALIAGATWWYMRQKKLKGLREEEARWKSKRRISSNVLDYKNTYSSGGGGAQETKSLNPEQKKNSYISSGDSNPYR